MPPSPPRQPQPIKAKGTDPTSGQRYWLGDGVHRRVAVVGRQIGHRALFPMTALFRGHRLYVHCSGGRVAAGSITLRGTLAVNSLPLMVMSAGSAA